MLSATLLGRSLGGSWFLPEIYQSLSLFILELARELTHRITTVAALDKVCRHYQYGRSRHRVIGVQGIWTISPLQRVN